MIKIGFDCIRISDFWFYIYGYYVLCFSIIKIFIKIGEFGVFCFLGIMLYLVVSIFSLCVVFVLKNLWVNGMIYFL